MPIELSARLHAFLNSLGQDNDLTQTQTRLLRLKEGLHQAELSGADNKVALAVHLAEQVLQTLELPADHPQLRPIANFLLHCIENLFEAPAAEITKQTSTSDLWQIRDQIAVQEFWLQSHDEVCDTLHLATCHIMDTLFKACPALTSKSTSDGIAVPTNLVHAIPDIGTTVEQLSRICAADELQELQLLQNIQQRLQQNLIAASGGNPNDPASFTKAPRYPSKSEITDPAKLVTTYLSGTLLAELLNQQVQFTLPTETRFEHHHIVAGSGHGKTQTLQYLIAKDLEAVIQGNRSIVVIDSQGDLIRNISQLAVFAPGGSLHDRIVIIDPTDVEYPVALNLFDVGQDRLDSYAPLERERLTNSILELYDFVLGSLLSAEMTQKQNVIFRYVTRLMLFIPNATIHTLRDLMEPNGSEKFADNIAQLSGSARHFFDTEFNSREFDQTKKQVLRRLWGILENQTFERMFTHPKSKLDLYAEMNAGKVILINTAKDLLKESGTEIFGRFFIALIAQAAQERSTIAPHNRMPTMVYVDEAADYFDRNVGVILSQARKYGIGMVLAHQYLAQLDTKLQEGLSANTSIKFAGGVSAKDARTLAAQLRCDVNLIEHLPKGTFAASIRGQTNGAVPLSFPFGHLEGLPTMTANQRVALQEVMRQRHSMHHSEVDTAATNASAAAESETPTTEEDEDDYLKPTPTW